MLIEIEAKIKVPALTPVRQRLQQLGARRLGFLHEKNIYFDLRDRTFQAQDKGLRLRQTQHDVRVCYKGPRRAGPFKQRREIEFTVGDVAQAADLLQEVGLVRTLSFEKKREKWQLGDTKVCLDEAPYIGTFVEIESSGAAAVQNALERLGLADRPHVVAPYVALLAQHLAENGIRDRDVVFTRPPELLPFAEEEEEKIPPQ